MRVLVLNGSPAGEDSITLYTALYLEKCFPGVEFEVLHVGRRIKAMEKDFAPCLQALERAELILFCYPVYTFLAPAQLHRFLELVKASGVDLSGRWATQITTSKHFYDTTAHQYIRDNCDDLGLRSLRGLSADMDDLLTPQGRSDAVSFFRHALWAVAHDCPEPAGYPPMGRAEPFAPAPVSVEAARAAGRAGKVALVTDLPGDGSGALPDMIRRFRAALPGEIELVDLRAFPFAGGCLGCFHCAADGTCVYRDGFDSYLREHIQAADAIVYAFTIRDHSMGARFKLYDDRQFCNGHRTVTMGKPVAYLVDGPLDREPNLRTLIEARAQVGGNTLAGIATNQRDPDGEIDRLALSLAYAVEHGYTQPKNFYGVGGLKIFRDLIYQMRGLMRADHRFYKAHGFYDFPQKRRGRIAAMYLVGAMMNSPRLRKKLGGRMTEGMVLPYRKALEQAAPEDTTPMAGASGTKPTT